jgi:cyclohexanone monooxygenase
MSKERLNARDGAQRRHYDVVVVGAGFGGMYSLYKLRSMGFSVRVFEQASDVGGTWYWNRYPGARCDIESLQYSYSFSEELQQEWDWKERYATQPEILKYAEHVADRFDLRRDITFDVRVESIHLDEASKRWRVTTSDGLVSEAAYVILATGILSNPQKPKFPGQEHFSGSVYYTAQWPHKGVDFTGLRVAIVGTGSSAIQSAPLIAKEADKLVIFQRTPNYSAPAHNRLLTDEERRAWKAQYGAIRKKALDTRNGVVVELNDKRALEDDEQTRRKQYEAGWQRGGLPFISSYSDLLYNLEANATAADFVRGKIDEIVKDPKTAELLKPHDHPLAAKRICVDTGYFEMFNRPNVQLADARTHPIEGLTSRGIRAGGEEFQFDAIIFATGFDAMTGSVAKIDIRGSHGTLNQKWVEGARSYLGLMMEGFPNLFTIAGPGSPSALANFFVSIEYHVDMVASILEHLRKCRLDTVEPSKDAEDAWVKRANEVAQGTIYVHGNSWYLGSNIPGKPRLLMAFAGGVKMYRELCEGIVARGYEGFKMSSARAPAAAMTLKETN